jgi:pyruvate dehydrogenase E2 component (dihydrolipoamide acetyltransferase)
MSAVTPVRMPKWGLSMQEGAIVDWWRKVGDAVAEGDELVDIETSKITNVCEAPTAGVLRRIIAQPGETLPVGALIAVLAEPGVADSDVDAFVADFQANFTPEEAGEEGAQLLNLSMIDVGGRSLQVGQGGAGEGPPVVFIHGYSGDLNNWMFNIEAVAAAHPVIALDLPGHGGSSKDVGDGSLRSLAGAVGAALDALKVENAHLVGHSLGAAVAARLALDRPGLARSLTLIAPAGFSADGVSEEFLTGVIEAQRAKDLRPFMEMLLADPAAVSKEMIDDVLKFKRLDGVEEALSAIRDRLVEGADAAALRAELHGIPSALVIASRNDPIVGAPDEAALPAGFKVVWIEGAAHMPHLEQAARVNALLAEAIGD